jgi:hypothetical protein
MNAVKLGLVYDLLSTRSRRPGSLVLPHARGVRQPLPASGPDKPIAR